MQFELDSTNTFSSLPVSFFGFGVRLPISAGVFVFPEGVWYSQLNITFGFSSLAYKV
jgi:hypothetical protein